MLGRDVDEFMSLPYQQPRESFFAACTKPGNQGIPGLGREVRGRHKDGRLMVLELTLSEFTHRGHRRFVAMVRDISKRKQLEQELLESGERERQRS
jgi:PAS domain S-box-containing protein